MPGRSFPNKPGNGSQAVRDACRDAGPSVGCLAWGLRSGVRWDTGTGYSLAHTGFLVGEGEERANKSSHQRNSPEF